MSIPSPTAHDLPAWLDRCAICNRYSLTVLCN